MTGEVPRRSSEFLQSSLEEAVQEDSLSKSQLYMAFTGKESHDLSVYFLDVHPFEIKPEQMDLAYQVVQKMRKLYDKPMTPSGVDVLVEYYAPCFRLIDKAYEVRDINAFNEAVEDLLGEIRSE